MDLRTPILFLVLPRGLRRPLELETTNSTLPFFGDPPRCESRNRWAYADRGLTESGGVDVMRRWGVPGGSPANFAAGEGARGACAADCNADLRFCEIPSRGSGGTAAASAGTGGYWGSNVSLICATRDFISSAVGVDVSGSARPTDATSSGLGSFYVRRS